MSISVPRPRCLKSSGRGSVVRVSLAAKSAIILCSILCVGISLVFGEIWNNDCVMSSLWFLYTSIYDSKLLSLSMIVLACYCGKGSGKFEWTWSLKSSLFIMTFLCMPRLCTILLINLMNLISLYICLKEFSLRSFRYLNSSSWWVKYPNSKF